MRIRGALAIYVGTPTEQDKADLREAWKRMSVGPERGRALPLPSGARSMHVPPPPSSGDSATEVHA